MTAKIPQVQTALTLSADESGHIAAVTASGSLSVLKNATVAWTAETGEKFTAAAFFGGTLYAATESNRLLLFTKSDGETEGTFSESGEIKCGTLRIAVAA